MDSLVCDEPSIDPPALGDPGGGAAAVGAAAFGAPAVGAAALGAAAVGAAAVGAAAPPVGDPDISGFNFAAMAERGELTREELFSNSKSVNPNGWPLASNFVEMLRLSGIEDVEQQPGDTEGSYNIIKMRKCKIVGEEKKVIFRHPKMEHNDLSLRVSPEGSEVLSDREKSTLRGEVLNKEFWRTCSAKGIIPEVYCHILFKYTVNNRLTTCMVSEMYDSDLWNYYHGRGGTAQEHAGVDKEIAEQLYSLLDDLLELDYWCVDLKPQNCVINLREGKPIVRLTDVDSGEGANEFCGKKEKSTYAPTDDNFTQSLGLLIKLILTIVFIVQLPVNIFSYLDRPPNSELFEDEFLVSCRLICLCNCTKYYEDPLIAGISAQMSLMIEAYMQPILRAMRNHIATRVAGGLSDDMIRASHIIGSYDEHGNKLISPMFFNVMWAIAKNGGEQIWDDVTVSKMTGAEEDKIIDVVKRGLDASPRQMKDQQLGIFDELACQMLGQPPQQGPLKKRKPATKSGGGYLKSSKKRRTKKRRTKKRRTKRRSKRRSRNNRKFT